MRRTWLSLASLFAFLSVILGAFAAHALSSRLPAHSLSAFRTGVEYQMVHSLALGILGVLGYAVPSVMIRRAYIIAGFSFTLGIALFSGSLYLLALTGTSQWGAITPLGGLSFLVGWISLILLSKRLP